MMWYRQLAALFDDSQAKIQNARRQTLEREKKAKTTRNKKGETKRDQDSEQWLVLPLWIPVQNHNDQDDEEREEEEEEEHSVPGQERREDNHQIWNHT